MYGAMQITGGKAEVSFRDAGPMAGTGDHGRDGGHASIEFLARTVKAERVDAVARRYP